MPTLHDPNNHTYIHPPCPQGITLTDHDLAYINNLRYMKLKELKEECINNNVNQTLSGSSTKSSKMRNLIANKLNKSNWWYFTWGEQQILQCFLT